MLSQVFTHQQHISTQRYQNHAYQAVSNIHAISKSSSSNGWLQLQSCCRRFSFKHTCCFGKSSEYLSCVVNISQAIPQWGTNHSVFIEKAEKMGDALQNHYALIQMSNYSERRSTLDQGTVDFGLDYRQGDGVRLAGYTDLDWASCVSDRKSTFGCCFGLGLAVVSWINRKQQSIALSSAEAEYMAASLASCEAIWLRKMLFGLFG
eukprot:PITA_02452